MRPICSTKCSPSTAKPMWTSLQGMVDLACDETRMALILCNKAMIAAEKAETALTTVKVYLAHLKAEAKEDLPSD